uniref:Uncharacterized protein n=1 Tax=Aegilops tauschii subsp. strangulata TaxID=200361 RepID=A0A453RTR2_AEGTS
MAPRAPGREGGGARAGEARQRGERRRRARGRRGPDFAANFHQYASSFASTISHHSSIRTWKRKRLKDCAH